MLQQLVRAPVLLQLRQWHQSMVAQDGLANAHKAMKMLAQLLLQLSLKL
jgi:hypothetical protein